MMPRKASRLLPAKPRKNSPLAFEYAIQNNRKKVTAVRKASILKCNDGCFEAARQVANAIRK